MQQPYMNQNPYDPNGQPPPGYYPNNNAQVHDQATLGLANLGQPPQYNPQNNPQYPQYNQPQPPPPTVIKVTTN